MGSQLLQGNCLEVMKDIPDNSVDLVLCDPPYGTTRCKWDAVIPFAPMWEQLHRIAKERAAIVVTCAQPFTSALVMSNARAFRYCWTWRKATSTGHLNAKKQPMRNVEDVAVFYQAQPTYNPQRRGGGAYKPKQGNGSKSKNYGAQAAVAYGSGGGRYPTQCLDFTPVQRGTVHPTQKPVDLMAYMIRTYSDPGDVVLDFAMGSGTTGVACKQEGREFIGIELDDEYFKIAKSRIEGVLC